MRRALVQGRIVRATAPDPQGRNPKNRRWVVVSPNEKILTENYIVLVGITSTIDSTFAEEYVEIPYGPGCITGFDEKSAAHCIWWIETPKNLVQPQRGYLPPKWLANVLESIKSLGARVIRQRYPLEVDPS